MEIEKESEIIDTASTVTVNEAMKPLAVVGILIKNGYSCHLFKAFNGKLVPERKRKIEKNVKIFLNKFS